MRVRAAFAVATLLLVGCAAPQPRSSVSDEPSARPTVATPSPTPSVPITVSASRYGSVQLRTAPSAACTLEIDVNRGEFGDGPPKAALPATAGADGLVAWTYPAPLIPAGRGRHVVSCSDSGRTSTFVSAFDIPVRTIDAKGFTVRVDTVDPVSGLAGANGRLEPSLVPPRDADAARMKTTLENEWKLATRGLGALTLVESSSDIAVYVLPGKGTSLHAQSLDGTQRVLIYAVDEFGTVSAENAVAVVLHELGHIWCCFGPDAGSDGHWLEKLPDPLLQGVDRFGLMTHPVTCLVGRGFQSCPNRFSERELRTMGFAEIPAPPPDPCVTQKDALTARLNTQRPAIDAAEAQLAAIAGKIRAIEAQYPSRVLPPDVYATYSGLVDQYNQISADYSAKVKAYNATIAQLNALPC